MDLYKIVHEGDRVYVQTLIYNPIWCGHQWAYKWVSDNYPMNDIRNAKDFGTLENAQQWINDHTP